MEEQIHQYIKQARQAGQREDEIKRSLLRVGWTEESLEPFFQKEQRRMSKRALVTIIILCTIIPIGVGVYFLWFSSGTDSGSSETTKDVRNESKEAVTSNSGEVMENMPATNEVVVNQNTTRTVDMEAVTGGGEVTCTPSTPRDSIDGLDFSVLINDQERAEKCQQIYNELDRDNLAQYPSIGGINGCIRYAILDTPDYSLCSVFTNDEGKWGCYMGAARTGLACECENISDETYQEYCYEEAPVIMQDLTLNDFPAVFQTRPISPDYDFYPEPEIVENVTDLGGGSKTISYEYHFSKLDPTECITLYNSEEYRDIGFGDLYKYLVGCFIDYAKITADETTCTLLDEIEFSKYCTDPEDTSTCTEIKEGEFRDLCILNIAEENASPVTCLSIPRYNNVLGQVDDTGNYIAQETSYGIHSFDIYSECVIDAILYGDIYSENLSQELCDVLKKTTNGNLSAYNECLEYLEEYVAEE